MTESAFGFSGCFDDSFESVTDRLKDGLKAEGFGVVSEIDVQETLRQKSDYRIGPYLILGVCNPNLAGRAIEAESDIGLLLPCNILLQRCGEATRVSIQDPRTISRLAENPAIESIAEEAYLHLRRVLNRLEE